MDGLKSFQLNETQYKSVAMLLSTTPEGYRYFMDELYHIQPSEHFKEAHNINNINSIDEFMVSRQFHTMGDTELATIATGEDFVKLRELLSLEADRSFFNRNIVDRIDALLAETGYHDDSSARNLLSMLNL